MKVGVESVGKAIGLVSYVAVGLVYLVSGLVVPVFPWLLILNAIWVGGLVLVMRLGQSRWWAPGLGALVAVAFWVGYLSAGDAWLGWTA